MIPNHEQTSVEMANLDFLWDTEGVLSTRVGTENMDGRAILIGRESRYARPWDQCIPLNKLSTDDLPPFHVRLRDDQVGHLAHYARSIHKSIAVRKLGLCWSWDFDSTGKILPSRDNYGPAYAGPCSDPGVTTLRGGPPLPAYIDPCLPPTYTSSDKIMPQGNSGLKQSAPLKRKAIEEAGPQSGNTSKKPYLSSVKSTTMKAEERKVVKLDDPAFEIKPRLFVENYSINEALSFYDTLTSAVRRSQDRIVELETEIESNDGQATAQYDQLDEKWEKCYAKTKKKVEKLKVELEVSDKLLQSSKATVTDQTEKLIVLQQTKELLAAKEGTIRTQKEQIARWEEQARAMLGGATPKSNDKAATRTPKTNPISKAENIKDDIASTKVPKSTTNITPQISKSAAKPATKPNGLLRGRYAFPPR